MKYDAKKMVVIALYVAIFVVLSLYGTIHLRELKITTQNLPIYVAAISLGMIPGAIVGFVGMLINQILTYGFTATTLFWTLPQTILGIVCGYIFEKGIVRIDQTNKFAVIILLLQLMITLLNTLVYAIDALFYGYFNYLVIFGPLIIKFMLSILTGIVYFTIIPVIVNAAKKIH